jgi:hypothetical protein
MNFINEIKATYLQYIEKHKQRPATIKAFCQIANLSETEFEAYFYSFEWLEDSIWQDLGKWTVQLTENYEKFNTFTLREKLSVFFYTLLQLLKAHKNFVQISLTESTVFRTDLRTYPNCLADFKTEIYSFFQRYETANRTENLQMVSHNLNSIADIFWLQCLLVIEKYQTDESENYTDTQATIEGGLNFIFKTV